MLEISDLFVSYGAITALGGISLKVPKGSIVTLIGGNGAGKTTTLRTVSGLLRPKSGKVTFMGEDITRLPAHAVVARGLGHVPEGRVPEDEQGGRGGQPRLCLRDLPAP
jgi:branched-chain amino acid transport system ATP-binding protein